MTFLHGLSINTDYSIIIVISCTWMINKVTQTRCSSMYFFLLTQYTTLEVLFQQRRTWTCIFFFYCLTSEKRTLRARHIKMMNNNFFNVFNQDAGVFFGSCVHPRNSWTDPDLERHKIVTSSRQDSPDFFTWSYFFDEFLQEMPEVNTELTETRGACCR